MPNCKRCGKQLTDDEFFLCKDCEEEDLYEEEFPSEEECDNESNEDYSYQ